MEARLDDFFTKLDAGPNSTRAYMGNEPCEGAPWLYEFLGRPDKAVATVRRIQSELFTTAASGMPGQDDGGGLASWYIFNALGLYPAVPGAAGVLVGSPLFPEIQLKSEDGRRWHIAVPGAGDANPYVSSMKIDAQENHSLWVPLTRLSGSVPHEIQFKLAPQPDPVWGTRSEDLPGRAGF